MTKNLNSFPFIICALFCCTIVKAQSFPDTAWTRCYGGSGIEYGFYISQTMDEGYIILGSSTSTDGDLVGAPVGDKDWIIKLDPLGNIEWQKHVSNNGYYRNIIQTTDGGYITGGTMFTKLLPNGNVEWQENIPSRYVLQTYDGGYALFNQTWITKLSSTYTVEWSYDYGTNPDRSYYTNSSFYQTSDSGFVFGGRWTDVDVPVFVRGAWLVKTDKNGIAQINKQEADLNFYKMLKPANDGNYIIIGGHTPIISNDERRIIKVDTAEIWHKNIMLFGTSDIIQNMDSTYVDCGDNASPMDAYITKRTANGDSIITKYFGGSDYDNFYTIIGTKDTGYIALGSTKSADGYVWGHHDSSDVWIVKFKKDTSTYVPTSISPDVSSSKMNEITVYPTLTNGDVHVQFPEGCENAIVEVYNITGQRVPVKISDDGNKRVVALGDLPGGQYILQVRNGGERKVFRVTLMP